MKRVGNFLPICGHLSNFPFIGVFTSSFEYIILQTFIEVNWAKLKSFSSSQLDFLKLRADTLLLISLNELFKYKSVLGYMSELDFGFDFF